MEEIINKFYTSFDNLDAEGMVACYHPNITFEDPAFGKLRKNRAKNMWRMLCDSQKGKDFQIIFSDITFDNNKGYAKWDAYYTFSQTGKKVHNEITAQFEFKNGLIIKHTDTFDLYKWAKQAMGLKGYLLGWTSFFKSKLQNTTNSLLDKFEKLKTEQTNTVLKTH